MYTKRLQVCLFGGVIAALACSLGGHFLLGASLTEPREIAGAMANRLLLGFVIAASGWRIQHLLHGALVGLFLSLSVSVGLVNNLLDFVAYTGAGTLYGVFIEWLATNVFHAPMKD